MLHVPIVPKNGHTARILAVTRVSDPREGKQDIRSLRDQRMAVDDFLKANLDIPYEVVGNNCAGKGELLDRREFLELIDLVETGTYDAVITEDLGRIVRRLKAIEFAETCVDFDTRLITLIEHIDTAEEGWQDNAFFSAYHHERANRDTSKRIKRTQLSSFLNDGRCAQHPIAGINKVEGSKSDREWSWTDQARGLKAEILRRVLNHEGPSSIADLFNSEKFPLGPRHRKGRWDHQMASHWLRNLLLKGVRYRNKRKTKRNAAGKYISKKADPSELKLRHVPHLELFTPQEFDGMQAVLTADGEAYRRGRKAAVDSRNGVPRKKTRAPGQMTYCGVCGYKYVFGGHGRNNSLTCDGSRQYQCWNGATFDAELASRRMLAAIIDTFTLLPDFDEAFCLLVNEEATRLDASRNAELIQLDRQLAEIDVGIRNLGEFIERGDRSDSIRERLASREMEKARLIARQLTLRQAPSAAIEIPSVADLKDLLERELNAFPVDSWEFRQVLGRIVPRLIVYPVQLVDGGDVVLRGEFDVVLSNLLASTRQRDVLAAPLMRRIVIDLFERPQRVQHLHLVADLRAQGLTFKEIGERLVITDTAAQRAQELFRIMQQRGLTDPYVRLYGIPGRPGMLRRHLHPRYEFRPLDGYPLK